MPNTVRLSWFAYLTMFYCHHTVNLRWGFTWGSLYFSFQPNTQPQIFGLHGLYVMDGRATSPSQPRPLYGHRGKLARQKQLYDSWRTTRTIVKHYMVILTEESTSWNHKSLMPHPCECCCRIPTPQDQGFSLCLSEVLRLRGRKSRENTSTKQNTPPQYLLSECSWGREYPSVSVPFLHFHGHRIMVQRAGFCTLHNHFRPDMGYSDF